MKLEGILNQALTPNTIQQMSKVIGADEGTTANAVQTALPLLLGAMTRNSASPEGASSLLSALDRDHDGSILNDLGGLIGGGYESASGAGILGHVFGDKLGAAETSVSKASGLDMGRVASLLMMLAPIVMGALGQTRRQGEIDQDSLPQVLGSAARTTASNSPVGDLLTGMLDRDGDGSSLDDILRIAGGFFRNRG